MTTEIRKLSLDPGFGNIKIAEVRGEALLYNTVTSDFGLGQVKNMGLLHAGLGRKKHNPEPVTVSYNGLSYVVGENVYKHVDSSDRLSFQKFGDAAALKPLVYTALAGRLNGGPYHAALVVGLPVEVMQSSDARATVNSLKSWLVNEHQFCLNGQTYQIIVHQVKATAQPLGSYFHFMMNTNGQWTKDKNLPVIVVDIGFNTVDLFGIEAGQLVNRYTAGDTMGIHRVARSIAKEIKDRYQVRYTLHQADLLVRDFVAGKPTLFYHAKGEDDISGLVDAALNDAFSGISEFVDRHLNDAQYRYLIITGGGAKALRDRLLTEYPGAIILPDPVSANAAGLAKFAQCNGVLAGSV